MGDERKISDPKEIVNRMLSNNIRSRGVGDARYNLEKEFEKTKSNKSYIIPVLIISFSILFAVIYLITGNISELSYDMTVGQKELKEISAEDIVNRYYDVLLSIESLNSEVSKLKIFREIEVKREVAVLSNSISITLFRTDVPENVKSKLIQDTVLEFYSKVEDISNRYSNLIYQKQTNIQFLKSSLKELKSKLSLLPQDVLSSYKRVVGIEIDKTRKYYENVVRSLISKYQDYLSYQERYVYDLTETLILRYNPVITNPRIISVLDEVESSRYNPRIIYSLPLIDSELSNYALDIVNKTMNMRILFEEISKIPFTNSLPKLFEKQEDLFDDLLNLYHSLIRRYLEYFIKANTALLLKANSLEYFVRTLVKNTKGIDGLVVDNRDPSNITVALKEDYSNDSYNFSLYRQGRFIGYGTLVLVTNRYIVKDFTFVTNEKILLMDGVVITK
ncbi:MAG: hypothetical protein N2712_05965 [Brevinematales bacterium]|nr:hypothetical protein [Brevinematales bacterium]